MFESIIVFALGLTALYVIGIPITQKAFHVTKDKLWSLAPFMSLGIIIVVLRTLVQFDIPTKYTAWPLFILFILYFIYWLKQNKGNLKQFVPTSRFAISVVLLSVAFMTPILRVGLKNYRGYGWWDQLFYATQADFFQNEKFSHLASLVQTKPYLASTWEYFEGYERIGRGIFQSFFSSLANVTGQHSLGIVGFIGLLLVFSATLYVCLSNNLKKNHSYLVAFFCAALPNVVTTQLEGFLPVLLFTSLALMITHLLPEALEAKNFHIPMLVGIFLAATFSIFADGFYLVLGVIIILFISFTFTKKISRKIILNLSVLVLSCGVSNLFYWKHFYEEITIPLARGGLNFIYPFANSVKVLNWALWGLTLEGSSELIYILFTLLATFIFIASILGVCLLFFDRRKNENLLMLVLVFMPLLFLVQKAELQYSFYKLFSFSIPVLMIGLFYFIEYLQNFIEKYWAVTPKWNMLGQTALISGLIAIFLFTSLQSIKKANLVLDPFNSKISIAEHRINFVRETNNPKYLKLYNELAELHDENILLINQTSNLSYWWSTYYAKNNSVYELSRVNQDVYLLTDPKPYTGPPTYRYFERVDYKKLPKDVIIKSAENDGNMITNKKMQIDYAGILDIKTKDSEKYASALPATPYVATDYRITTFGREDATYIYTFDSAKPNLNLDAMTFKLDEKVITPTLSNNKLKLPLKAGGHQLEIAVPVENVIDLSVSLKIE